MRFNLDSGKYICDKCNFSLDECQCFKKHEFDAIKEKLEYLNKLFDCQVDVNADLYRNIRKIENTLKALDYKKLIDISVTADDVEKIINHPDFIPESNYNDVVKYFGEIGKIGVVRFKRGIKRCDNELDKTLDKRCELDADLHDFLSSYVRYINDSNLLEKSNEKYNKILDKWGK